MAEVSSLLEAALSYAARGWKVLPLHNPIEEGACSCGKRDCGSPGKHPRTKNGLKDATLEEATIRRWWTTFPLANVGILTGTESGIFVLDIDGQHGGDDTLLALREEQRLLPTTVCARTGSGEHYYFAHSGGSIPNSAGRLGDGLDVRGDGGYVVAPPSLHYSGRLYSWEGSGDPDEVAPAEPPSWLLTLLQRSPDRKTPPALEVGADDLRIPQGGRNNVLTSMAGSMRRRGFSPEAILAALNVENGSRCTPPLSSAEIRKIASSVGRYPPAESALSELADLASPARTDGEQPPADWLRPGDGLAARPVPMARVSLASVFPTLHRSTRDGLPTGSVVCLQGPPDSAKTGIAQTIADAAELQGWTVVHFAPDNGREPAEIRYGQLLGFDRTKLEEGDPQEVADFRAVFAARRFYMPDPDLCDENLEPINTLDHVIEEAKRLFPGRRVLLLPDSVQTVIPDRGKYDSLRTRVIATMKLFRKAVTNPGWLVVAPSQINREAFKHKRESKNTVRIAAGAESASIEFGSDLMLYLEPTGEGVIRVEVTKNKPGAGRRPEFPLIWDRNRARASEPDAASFADESLKIAEQAREQFWGELAAIVKEQPGLATSRIAEELRRAGHGRRKVDVPPALRQMAKCQPPRIRMEKKGNAELWYPVDAEPAQRTL